MTILQDELKYFTSPTWTYCIRKRLGIHEFHLLSQETFFESFSGQDKITNSRLLFSHSWSSDGNHCKSFSPSTLASVGELQGYSRYYWVLFILSFRCWNVFAWSVRSSNFLGISCDLSVADLLPNSYYI